MTGEPTPLYSWPRRAVRRGAAPGHDARPLTAVYSLYAADGEEVYIGCSYDPEKRIKVHLGKPWGRQVVSWSADWFRNRAEAERVEAERIGARMPRYNTYWTARQGQAITDAIARQHARNGTRPSGSVTAVAGRQRRRDAARAALAAGMRPAEYARAIGVSRGAVDHLLHR